MLSKRTAVAISSTGIILACLWLGEFEAALCEKYPQDQRSKSQHRVAIPVLREEAFFTKGRVIVRGKAVNGARLRKPTTSSTSSPTSPSLSSRRQDPQRSLCLQFNGDGFLGTCNQAGVDGHA